MKRKVKRPFDNEQFRKGYVAGIFAAEKELNTQLLHFAEKAHKIMSEGTFPDYGVKINFKDSNNTIATNLDMKTEEKAKRYDEALEWMRELYPGLHGATKEDAEHYFPELKESKESEDERIRRSIVTIVEQYARVCEKEGDPCEVSLIDDALSYLEKQKEQIPYIDFVIKPHKSDDTNPYDMSVSEAQDYATNRGFDVPFNDGEVYVDERHITQTIGNILRWADEHPKEQKPAEWSEEDEKMYNIFRSMVHGTYVVETQESMDSLLSWLKSLKNRGNFPKSNTNSPSEWSKEDEKMLLSIIKAFRNGSVSTIGQEQWLKLLPERFNLQPSLEHLQKEKVYDIMVKLTNLSYSNLIPFNSEEFKKIHEVISDVYDLLKYPIKK